MLNGKLENAGRKKQEADQPYGSILGKTALCRFTALWTDAGAICRRPELQVERMSDWLSQPNGLLQQYLLYQRLTCGQSRLASMTRPLTCRIWV